jgi:hypothetical protein
MLSHFLAALAYRTQKALRGAPENFIFADIDPSNVSENQAQPQRPDQRWPEELV